jgi:hypothetical protein
MPLQHKQRYWQHNSNSSSSGDDPWPTVRLWSAGGNGDNSSSLDGSICLGWDTMAFDGDLQARKVYISGSSSSGSGSSGSAGAPTLNLNMSSRCLQCTPVPLLLLLL